MHKRQIIFCWKDKRTPLIINSEVRDNMKKNHAIIFICICLLGILSGCGAKSDAKIKQSKVKECFSDTNLLNCKRIDFLYYEDDERTRFSCLCRKKDINTIYCKKLDFYECVYRTYEYISDNHEAYDISLVNCSEKEITSEEKSHYVQIELEDPIDIQLADETMDSVYKILFDVENGNCWFAKDDEKYTYSAKMIQERSHYICDAQMAYYIEGNWEHPPYDTVVEALDYHINRYLTGS